MQQLQPQEASGPKGRDNGEEAAAVSFSCWRTLHKELQNLPGPPPRGTSGVVLLGALGREAKAGKLTMQGGARPLLRAQTVPGKAKSRTVMPSCRSRPRTWHALGGWAGISWPN